ncbi:MAG: NAD(P)-dependent oxidoreductase [Myxococcota bacterium]|jgi:nucleoside-diphosphate-sugar epimerase|nr:NAD(P)-dependent oxidoreductase [Myxococcota bacterium]
MSEKRVVVLGASGLMGIPLVSEGLRLGREVVAVVDDAEHPPQLPQGVQARLGELSDRRFLQRVLEGAEHVICARCRDSRLLPSVESGEVSGESPLLQLSSLALILDCCEQAGVEHFVFISSASLYQEQRGLRDERTPLRARDEKQQLLLDSEAAVLACGERAAMAVTVLRPAFLYGVGGYSLVSTLAVVPVLLGARMALLPGFRGGPRSTWCSADELAQAAYFVLGSSKARQQCFNVGEDTPLGAGELLTYLTAAQELPIGPLLSWPPHAVLRALRVVFEQPRGRRSPSVSSGRPPTRFGCPSFAQVLQRLLDTWWDELREDYGLCEDFKPQLNLALLDWACDDVLLSSQKLRQLGFAPNVPGIYEGLAATIDSHRQRRCLPDLRSLHRRRRSRGLRARLRVPLTGYAVSVETGQRSAMTVQSSVEGPLPMLRRSWEWLVDGAISLPGCEAALFEGTLVVERARRQASWDLAWRGADGRALRLISTHRWSRWPWRILESMSTLPFEIINDRGQVMYHGHLRYDLEAEFWPSLLSCRFSHSSLE